MKFIDIILLFIIGLMILSGIVIPIVLIAMIDSSQKSIEEMIVIIGGSSSPFIAISAVLFVFFTFLYQRRNDLKIQSKELVLNSLYNIKEEFKIITTKKTKTKKDPITKETIEIESLFEGRSALNHIVEKLNSDDVELEIMKDWPEANSMVNIFRAVNGLIDELTSSKFLFEGEKDLLLTQIKLFYSNNLFIDKRRRGDIYCEFHEITHQFPLEWKKYIDEIESKLILNF